MTGHLLVCATPIGNLGDVTLRVLDALRAADVIAAEDTRVTVRLLSRYGIETPLERYDEHTAVARTPVLVERIAAGSVIALASDAGTPGISDPGARLVDACLHAGLPVEVLPGPSAIVTALVASGLPTHAFYFGGFLPRKAGERKRALEPLRQLDATLVFYESPRRTAATLVALAEEFPGREAAMARELTKVHEEVARDDIESLARSLADRELKGEVVLLVGPPRRQGEGQQRPSDEDLLAEVHALVLEGVRRTEAVKRVSRSHGLPRDEVYRLTVGR